MKKTVFLILISCCVAGCAEIAPFIDSRREAGQVELVGQSKPNRVAVCHHRWWHEEETVRALAEAECAQQNKKAVYDGQAFFNCRFMTPTTSFYRCE